MRGLIAKDLYMMKSNLLFLSITIIIVGGRISILTTPAVIITVAATIFSVVEVTTINIDKSCGWIKLATTMFPKREEYLESKYILYMVLCFVGTFLGNIICITVMGFSGNINIYVLEVFTLIGLNITLMSGIISIPCTIYFNEELSALALLISYIITGVVGAVILWGIGNYYAINTILMEVLLILFPIVLLLYLLSFFLTRQIFEKMELY